jgi:hypothetical protein
LGEVRTVLVNDQEMQSDRSRLIRLCSSQHLPSSLRKAPRPANLLAEYANPSAR